MTKPICEVKQCLLDDREEDISQYIEDEILSLITRLELKHPDVHPGCLRMKVKKHLEYQSVKILMDLTLEYDLAKKRSGVSQ